MLSRMYDDIAILKIAANCNANGNCLFRTFSRIRTMISQALISLFLQKNSWIITKVKKLQQL